MSNRAPPAARHDATRAGHRPGTDDELIEGACRSSMDELAERTLAADKVPVC
ncbi:hypothetical protein U5801_23845 [Lamprobacter modestohalophilus]|uniref:hypothetical protein n=1 Tax=Lamprobacter modestohalophilus TaxID=1064514 RepID=UPI002ADECE5C|nr:hypothetical protein [Lamprobacter modestohalophilus]MEA1052819.1 hypothetical protein [Lamprobacter modestohalophilus]